MDNNNPNPNNGNPEKKPTIRQRFTAWKHALYAKHPMVHKAVNGVKYVGVGAAGAVAGWKLRGKYSAKVTGGETPMEEAPAEEEPTAE